MTKKVICKTFLPWMIPVIRYTYTYDLLSVDISHTYTVKQLLINTITTSLLYSTHPTYSHIIIIRSSNKTHTCLNLGLSLICSKIYLLFLPKLLKIFTYYSYFILITPPIIPIYSIVSVMMSQCRGDYI